MKPKSPTRRKKTGATNDAWLRRWEPFFRAAEQGRLPNNLPGLLEALQCRCAARRGRFLSRADAC